MPNVNCGSTATGSKTMFSIPAHKNVQHPPGQIVNPVPTEHGNGDENFDMQDDMGSVCDTPVESEE